MKRQWELSGPSKYSVVSVEKILIAQELEEEFDCYLSDNYFLSLSSLDATKLLEDEFSKEGLKRCCFFASKENVQLALHLSIYLKKIRKLVLLDPLLSDFSFVHRVFCPVLVLTSLNAKRVLVDNALTLSSRIPSCWYSSLEGNPWRQEADCVEITNEMVRIINELNEVPNKRSQKSRNF